MITKKRVELIIAVEKEERTRDMGVVLDQLGWERTPYPFDKRSHYVPAISTDQRLNAICAYLGIEIVKESHEEKIVAKKIKKAK